MTLLFCISLALPAFSNPVAAGEWEQLKTEVSGSKSVVKEGDIEILTAPSMIIVNSSRPIRIQVFTILGRLVSSETLPSGISRLSVPTHGVYIIKTGELTCKVAL